MYTERELVRELKNGNELAIGFLVKRYSDRLLRIAYSICGDLQIAEEVVQDTMLQTCRKIDYFNEQAALSTWLYRITVNGAKNRLRSNWFRKVSSWDVEKMKPLAAPAAEQPENRTLRAEIQQQILQKLQQLPLKYREVLSLYYLEDFSIEQLSSVLAQPPGTIKSKLFRGRKMLRALWCNEEGE